MASLEGPPQKIRKVGSHHQAPLPSSGVTANFMYFGLEVPLNESYNRVPFCDLPEHLAREIKEDYKRFNRGGFPRVSSLSNTAFQHIEGTNIWVFQHTIHAACSGVTFKHFNDALTIGRGTCGSCICFGVQPSHVMLEPFFYDNISLERIYSERIRRHPPGQEQEVELLHRVRKVLQDPNNLCAAPDEFSTGGAPLDVRGCMLNEDTWSLRLAGCLKHFLPKNFDVAMTGKLGMAFTTLQMSYTGVPSNLCLCYPFHGAPDLTVKDYPIVIGTEEAAEERESGSEPDCVIEHSIQAPRLVPQPPKLGELLANMHVNLVKKILRAFVHKKNPEPLHLACRGLLIHKAIGGIVCEMSVDLKKNASVPLTVWVDDFCMWNAVSTITLPPPSETPEV